MGNSANDCDENVLKRACKALSQSSLLYIFVVEGNRVADEGGLVKNPAAEQKRKNLDFFIDKKILEFFF